MKSPILILTFIFVISLNAFSKDKIKDGKSYHYTFKLVTPQNSDQLLFNDSIMSISFKITEKGFSVNLKNVTNNKLQIIWDECAVIKDGKSSGVIHDGIKYIDKEKSQIPTTIPPLSMIEELIVPKKNIELLEIIEEWIVYDLFSWNDCNTEKGKKEVLDNKGKTFSLFLPLSYRNKNLDYKFDFLIEDITPIN